MSERERATVRALTVPCRGRFARQGAEQHTSMPAQAARLLYQLAADGEITELERLTLTAEWHSLERARSDEEESYWSARLTLDLSRALNQGRSVRAVALAVYVDTYEHEMAARFREQLDGPISGL